MEAELKNLIEHFERDNPLSNHNLMLGTSRFRPIILKERSSTKDWWINVVYGINTDNDIDADIKALQYPKLWAESFPRKEYFRIEDAHGVMSKSLPRNIKSIRETELESYDPFKDGLILSDSQGSVYNFPILHSILNSGFMNNDQIYSRELIDILFCYRANYMHEYGTIKYERFKLRLTDKLL